MLGGDSVAAVPGVAAAGSGEAAAGCLSDPLPDRFPSAAAVPRGPTAGRATAVSPVHRRARRRPGNGTRSVSEHDRRN